MITISMEGVNDAFETIKDTVVPWRRKNAERKAKLENALRQAEIQRLNGESLIAQAKAERERSASILDSTQAELTRSQARKTEAEAKLILAQADKTMAEAERERASLRQSQIELALSIIDKYASSLNFIQKMEYVIRLLPILDQLTLVDLGLH